MCVIRSRTKGVKGWDFREQMWMVSPIRLANVNNICIFFVKQKMLIIFWIVKKAKPYYNLRTIFLCVRETLPKTAWISLANVWSTFRVSVLACECHLLAPTWILHAHVTQNYYPMKHHIWIPNCVCIYVCMYLCITSNDNKFN